jgi:ATP-binding cassette subfamily B protein RaxB
VAQRDSNDCGAAALAMVARHSGLNISLEEVRGRLRLQTRGASLAEMRQAAVGLGLGGRPVRIGLKQLSQVALPAIALLESGHYVVLYDLPGASALVGDPARGVVKLPVLTFCQGWGGHLLLMTRRE